MQTLITVNALLDSHVTYTSVFKTFKISKQYWVHCEPGDALRVLSMNLLQAYSGLDGHG